MTPIRCTLSLDKIVSRGDKDAQTKRLPVVPNALSLDCDQRLGLALV